MRNRRTRRARGALAALAAIAALDPFGWSAAHAANVACSSRVFNEKSVVALAAQRHASEFNKIHLESDEGWWFLDRLVPMLQRKDPRWGYNCKRGDCRHLSKDAIAYNCDPGRSEGSANVAIIDVVTGSTAPNPGVGWLDQTQTTIDHGAIGRWKSSRPGARTGTPSAPVPSVSAGVACSNQAPNDIAIVRQAAQQYASEFNKLHYESDEGWWFLDRLVPMLQRKDPRWGYNCKRGDCRHLSKDAIAYNCSPGITERSDNVAIIDVAVGSTAPNPRVGWLDQTSKGRGRWVSSRPGARTGGSGGGSGGGTRGRCGAWAGPSDASCEAGEYHSHPPDGDGEYRWTCRSVPRYLGEERCAEPKPAGGVLAECGAWAGPSDASCAAGEYHSHPPDTDGEFLWTCRSVPHDLGEERCNETRPASACGPDRPSPGWRDVGGECLPSCRTARDERCAGRDCSGWGLATTAAGCRDDGSRDVEPLESFEEPCCMARPAWGRPAPEPPAPLVAAPPSAPAPLPSAPLPSAREPRASELERARSFHEEFHREMSADPEVRAELDALEERVALVERLLDMLGRRVFEGGGGGGLPAPPAPGPAPVCPADRREPDWRAVGSECLPSCRVRAAGWCRSGANSAYCGSFFSFSADPSVCGDAEGRVARDVPGSHDAACCMQREKSVMECWTDPRCRNRRWGSR